MAAITAKPRATIVVQMQGAQNDLTAGVYIIRRGFKVADNNDDDELLSKTYQTKGNENGADARRRKRFNRRRIYNTSRIKSLPATPQMRRYRCPTG